jgi:outer membrane protein assembly factor BamB
MLDQLIFVGFNSRVAALNRDTGETVWTWKGDTSGYISLLLDGDRLIVSIQGYTWCVDPLTGQTLWYNNLPGMGTGVPSLASVRGTSLGAIALGAAAEEEHRRRSSD